MKKDLKILAIIFSVVLNIVLVGLYVDSSFGPSGGVRHRAKHGCLLYEELNLDHDQLERLEPLRDSFHAFVNDQGRRIKARQLELVGLLAQEQPDRRAIAAQQEEIQALQRQMQAEVIDHLLEESRILTPKQRRRFFALLKARIDRSAGPRPQWMPRVQGSPAPENRP